MHLAHSLRFRLIVLYLLGCLVPAVIMMTAMPFYYEKSISNETQILTQGTLTSIASNIETYLDDLNRLTITPYLNDDIMRALKLKGSKGYSQADSYTQLMADRALRTTLPLFLQNSRQDILATVLVFPDGSSFIASVGNEISQPVADFPYTSQAWYRKAMDANGGVAFISSHPQDYLSNSGNQQVFSVARLIRDPDTRQPLGVIMADADTVVLARIASDIQFNVSSIVCIFDAQNELLYSNRPLSASMQAQVTENSGLVRSSDDSYVVISKPIAPAGWKVAVLLSNAEIAAKTRWLYVAGSLFAVGGLLLSFLLFFILSRRVVQPFQEMITVMKQVQQGNLRARFNVTGRDEIAELGQALNRMIERILDLIDREYKAVISQRNAEYHALQSQIQPHFLYNTLNGFIGLNRLKDTAGLEKAIFALSGMLHYTLEGEEWVRLEDEYLFVRKYCDLQQIRFGDRLTIYMECADAIKDMKVPKLMLQPLVENAMIHGIEPAGWPCTLKLIAVGETEPGGSYVTILVEDDGCGFDVQSLSPKEGLGLANLQERLRLAFQGAALSITSQKSRGTQIQIKIPLQQPLPEGENYPHIFPRAGE
jgi:two-component system sensor histidine kinase YesM